MQNTAVIQMKNFPLLLSEISNKYSKTVLKLQSLS